MAGAMIGRLFYEIGGKTDELNASFVKSMALAKEHGIGLHAVGQRMVASFNAAINPCENLNDKLIVLQKSGATNAQIWSQLGDQITKATAISTKMGFAIPPVVAELNKVGAASKTTGLSVGNLGQTMIDFSRNPVEGIKTGLTSMLTTLGPTAVGIGALAGAAIAAGIGLYKMAEGLASSFETLENLSAVTGETIGTLQALKQITTESGLEGLDLARGIAKLSEQLGDKKPNDFTDSCARMGIGLKDASGKAKDAIAILDEMRLVLQGVTDKTLQTQMANQVLSGRMRDWQALLINSEKPLKTQIQDMKDSGVATSELANKNMKELDTMFDRIHRRLTVGKTVWANWFAAAANWAATKPGGGVLEMLGITPEKEEAANRQGQRIADAVNRAFLTINAKAYRSPEDIKKEIEEAEKAAKKLTEAILAEYDALSKFEAKITGPAAAMMKGLGVLAPWRAAGLSDQLQKDADDLADRISAKQDAMMKTGEPSPGAQQVQEYFQTRWDAQQKAITDANKKEYESMIDSVRRGAGEVFDAMVSRGKGAFQSLIDWVETFFLSRLKMLFQNLMAALFSAGGEGFSFGNLFKGVIPNFGKNLGSGLATSAAGVAGGLGNEGFWSPVSTMPTWSGGQINTGLSSGVGQLSRVGAGITAGAGIAGAAMLSYATQSVNQPLGAAGGALAGASVGMVAGPVGAAVGAGMGALIGWATSAAGKFAKIQAEVAAKNEVMRSSRFMEGAAINFGGALETDIMGQTHEWGKSQGVTVNVQSINLVDGRHARDAAVILANEISRVIQSGGSVLSDTLRYEGAMP